MDEVKIVWSTFKIIFKVFAVKVELGLYPHPWVKLQSKPYFTELCGIFCMAEEG